MKVLLVDDSGTMRSIEKKILSGLGVTDIVEAANGQEALTALGAGQFDVVLMDWNMPKVSGIDALKHMKAHPIMRSVPVIMVTSESEKSQILEAMKLGAANYVVKPFTAEVIQEKLAPFLKKDAPPA